MKRPTGKSMLLVLSCAALALTAACNQERREDRILYDGIYFKTKVKPVDKKESLAHFQVNVDNAGRSVELAREAGRDAGTGYCVRTYGSSKIDWIVGPDTDSSQLPFDKGDLIMSGVCKRP